MRTLYLDCFAGISGDMFAGALLDLGLNMDVLQAELRKLPVSGYRLQARRVNKLGLQATHFKVILDSHGHEHDADAQFTEVNETPAAQPHSHTHEHRALSDILHVIAHSTLSPAVKANASAIFTRLGQAEAQVHGVPVDEVHFHEVGGVDAIVDIVSAAIGIEQMGIEQVIVSPLHLGSGFVRMSHGTYPIPAPATAILIAGMPAYATEAKGEMVTPTGAAIAATLANGTGAMPLMTVERAGYGAGTRNRDFPNVLRAFLGESQTTLAATSRQPRTPHPTQHASAPNAAGFHTAPATVIEANIDDMNPQWHEPLIERLLAAGAMDVIMIPAQMKKQRAGVMLQVLAQSESVDALLGILFSESTTIGARTYEVTKHMLQRELRVARTAYGDVRVKVALLNGNVVNTAPEYEDCRAIAAQHGVPVKVVHAAAMAAIA
jgi:uncharacterized protein (TIGR00299 family) protein